MWTEDELVVADEEVGKKMRRGEERIVLQVRR